MITLTIPEASPSLNEHKWKHWSKHTKLRRHWSMLVLIAKNEARISPMLVPPDKVTVHVIREGHRRLDKDNFIGGLKSLIDSLREQRLIVDDSEEHMDLVTEQKQIPKSAYPRTIVEITEFLRR